MDDLDTGDLVTPCMYVYKASIQSDKSLEKLSFGIVVRGDLQNEEMIEYTWSKTTSMRILKYFLEDYSKH